MLKIITSIIEKYLLPITLIILLSIPLLHMLTDTKTSNFPDDFLGRDYLVSKVNGFRYFVIKDRVYEQMLSDTKGWFMLTDQTSMNNYQNSDLFSPEELEYVGNKLSYLCDFTTKYDIDLIFIVPPNKNTIYPEYLPTEIIKLNQKSRLDQVIEIWKETDRCNMLDLRKVLIESKSFSQLYFSTDTHWNDNGVFIAHKELTKILAQKYPSVHEPSLDDYIVEDKKYRGDLIGRNFGQINTSEIAPFYSPIADTGYFLITSVGVWGLEVNESYNVNADLPSVIVYRDSFFTSWVPFLAQTFREAHYYWTYVIDPNRIAGQDPDVLIYEITERTLINLKQLPNQTQYYINW